MRYLSFDIECCDGKHICEFGYVITNDKFKVIKKDVFIINPDKPFDLTGRKDHKDLTLFFSEETYFNGPLFTVCYDKIKTLLEAPNQIIVGHAIENDIAFLRTACNRYGLDPLNFSFLDSQKLYSEYANDKENISLEAAANIFGLEKPQYLHKSDDDALLAIRLVEKICTALETTLQDARELCPAACGKSQKINIMYTGDSLEEMLEVLSKNPEALSNQKKKQCIRKFSNAVKPTTEIPVNKLNGTQICFGAEFELAHTKETIILIQLLANCACKYNPVVSEDNFYVASESELNEADIREHTRYYAATHREDGHTVEILSLQDLCDILGISQDSLSKTDMPKLQKKSENKFFYSTGDASATLGEIVRLSGVDLKEIP